jgi:hypothetical protein
MNKATNKEKKDDQAPKPPPAPQLPNLPWSPDDPFHPDLERKEPVTKLPDPPGTAPRKRIPEEEESQEPQEP